MKVFIAGPRAISQLDKNIEARLNNIYSQNMTVLVGDASGIDSSIQEFFNKKSYKNVIVFASQGKARNNLGDWQIQNVYVADNLKGFDYYAEKDKAMAREADYGFMIWNGKSKGTLNNILNLVNSGKKSLVYFVPFHKFICIDTIQDLDKLVSYCDTETNSIYNKLRIKAYFQSAQFSLLDNVTEA